MEWIVELRESRSLRSWWRGIDFEIININLQYFLRQRDFPSFFLFFPFFPFSLHKKKKNIFSHFAFVLGVSVN